MLRKVVLALIVAVAVTLACILVGRLMQDLSIQVAVTVGNFVEKYGSAIGILSGLWFFFSN